MEDKERLHNMQDYLSKAGSDIQLAVLCSRNLSTSSESEVLQEGLEELRYKVIEMLSRVNNELAQGHSFDEAMEAIRKRGCHARRKAWSWNHPWVLTCRDNGTFVLKKTGRNGGGTRGWVPTIEDLQANDWIIFEGQR